MTKDKTMAQRQYESATVFGARMADMRHLWTPSDTYKGQKTQKPNYFGTYIVKKTAAHWSQEPIFGSVMQAFQKLLAGSLQPYASDPMRMVQWPISDGDLPSAEGKSSEFAKGHWLFSASSGNPPNVEMVQAGAQAPVKLHNKVGVKSGDYVMVGVTAAVKANQANGVKFYLNATVFTAPGEEIVFANSVSGAELMRMAQQQGFNIAGFNPSPGGFGGAPAGGFAPPVQQGQGGGGFIPAAPALGTGTFAPPPTIPAVQGGFAPQPGNGATAFPSSAAPMFTPPPPNGFGGPQR